jgi:hypothetical protein
MDDLSRGTPPTHSEYQCQDEKHQEYEEKYFGDAGCGNGNSGKPKDRGDDGDDEKYDCPVEHASSLRVLFLLRLSTQS